MCTRDYYNYSECGCRTIGEFRHCDERYYDFYYIQCVETKVNELQSRGSCRAHLVKVGKGKIMDTTNRAGRESKSEVVKGVGSKAGGEGGGT